MSTVEEIAKQLAYLARALKAPRIGEAAARLGDQARAAGWSHEEYLAAVLDREVSARDASGARLRTRAAGFGATKTIEDFVFDHQPGLNRDTIAHLATGTFLTKAQNVVLIGPAGRG
jgi:DNA replication protein DnaC